MQLMLIFGIVFAIAAVSFALQNDVSVVVTMAMWQFEGSLALVLLLALGLGVLITGLMSSPTVIRRQWMAARLRRQVTDLEKEVADLQNNKNELLAKLALMTHKSGTVEPEVVTEKPYVGLKAMLVDEDDVKP